MTQALKIAVAQMNPIMGDFAGNVTQMLDYATRAHAAGATLIVWLSAGRLIVSA
jgi:NAD+ synthase (glutamine-hydrolysing)